MLYPHYEFLSELGEGSFGTVFKAYDEINDRIVAIKATQKFGKNITVFL